jgi:hypothetical protein
MRLGRRRDRGRRERHAARARSRSATCAATSTCTAPGATAPTRSSDDRRAAARGYAYHSISDHSLGRGDMGTRVPALARAARPHAGARRRTASGRCARARSTSAPTARSIFDDEVLAELDIVIASVHDALRIGRDEMTARIMRACENPYVNDHRSPDRPQRRCVPGYEFDYDASSRRRRAPARRSRSTGSRSGSICRAPSRGAPAQFGVTFALDSDAHAAEQLANVAVLRRVKRGARGSRRRGAQRTAARRRTGVRRREASARPGLIRAARTFR